MDTSGNLISLSDSGISVARHPGSDALFPSLLDCTLDDGLGGTGNINFASKAEQLQSPQIQEETKESIEENHGTELLIDLEGEIQVPVIQAILTQAEVDDTFGIFSKAQSCQQESGKDVALGQDVEEPTEATVKCETSQRLNPPLKSTGAEAEQLQTVIEDAETSSVKAVVMNNDSIESCTSDQPTIVDEDVDVPELPALPENLSNADESGICGVKMDLGRNLSAGSDSEILDINDLSSFSIPDLDENEYLEGFMNEHKQGSTVSSAIINEIKLEILKEDKNGCTTNTATNTTDTTTSTSTLLELPDICPSVKLKNRLSSTSSVDGYTSRLNSTRLSSTSSVSNDDHTVSSTTNGRTVTRLSAIMGSPIRTSYPTAKYMPTPSGRSPFKGYQTRDKLSESLCSPTRTRVFLQTGGAVVSPSRVPVPVRKSISAETLHFQQSPARIGSHIKFSTPSASRTRYSFHGVQEHEAAAENSVADGDDLSNYCSNHLYSVHENKLSEAQKWTQPRLTRLSFASTCSGVSSNIIPSPSRRADMSALTRQMMQININTTTSNATKVEEGLHGGIRPLRATAVVPPAGRVSSNVNSSGAKINSTLRVHSAKPTGQHFVPPIAASSPREPQSSTRPVANQTTPSRNKYSNARASGYGQRQQNLNSTFEAKRLLKSPNKISEPVSGPKAVVKPAAIPRSLKGGVPSLGLKARPGSGTVSVGRTTVQAVKTGSLRRPAAAAVSSNKENSLRPGVTKPRQ